MDGGRLSVADADMLDGTPLLDIKPYVPAFDSFQDVATGWYTGKSAAAVKADGRFEAQGGSKQVPKPSLGC